MKWGEFQLHVPNAAELFDSNTINGYGSCHDGLRAVKTLYQFYYFHEKQLLINIHF
jgi:hypothetical protein